MLKSSITLKRLGSGILFLVKKLQGRIMHLAISVLPFFYHMQQHIWHTRTWRDEESIAWSETSASGFVAAVLSLLVSWAEFLHYMKLHAAVSKWLPLCFRLSDVKRTERERKYVLLRMHTD